MDLKRLRYFLRVAGDGSVSKAAGVLRIAQPALSRQMKLLEDELGAPLFLRSKRGMQLSPFGEQVRNAVAGPLRELELSLEGLSQTQGSPPAFTIGMPSNLGRLLIGPIVAAAREARPHVHLRFVDGPTGSLIEWLARGIVDFAIVEEPSRHERLNDRILKVTPMILLGKPGVNSAHLGPVSFASLAGVPLILPPHHLGWRAVIEEAAHNAGVTLDIAIEVDCAEAILDLVLSGVASTIIPKIYCTRTESLFVRPVEMNSKAIGMKVVVSTRSRKATMSVSSIAMEDLIVRVADGLFDGVEVRVD